MKLPRQSGFTLLELLVAMGIFALMAAMAYGGLNVIMKEREATDQRAARLAHLQTSFFWLGRDIEQAINRPIRDEYGDRQPALSSADIGIYRLELTRAGWRNPAGRARSHLQRVAYSVRDNQLIRSYWNVLDRAQDSQPLETVLLDGVIRMDLRFLASLGTGLNPGQNQGAPEWNENWPDNGTGATPTDDLPVAVEITLETESEGRITRLFRVPG
jgi:general secretion pathway protein J